MFLIVLDSIFSELLFTKSASKIEVKVGLVCIGAKWLKRPELIPVSVA